MFQDTQLQTKIAVIRALTDEAPKTIEQMTISDNKVELRLFDGTIGLYLTEDPAVKKYLGAVPSLCTNGQLSLPNRLLAFEQFLREGKLGIKCILPEPDK